MGRVLLSLFLLGCTLLAYAVAEFGSIGTVQSSRTIKSTVDDTTILFSEDDRKNGLVLETDYSLFTTVLPLIESLGTQVKNLGTALTTAISTGVPNSSGNLNAVFTPIQNAVTQLIQFIDGQQAATRTTLTDMLGPDINNLFGDVFGNMRLALLQIQSSFSQLKQALQTATIVSGQARISANVVSSVVTAVNNLRSTALPVQYLIFTTIENIQLGDGFLYDLENISVELISSLQGYLDYFTTELQGLGLATEDEQFYLTSAWSAVTDGIAPVTTNLASLPDYSTFAGALSSLASSYDSLDGIDEAVSGTFGTYLSTAQSYLTQFQDVLVPLDYLSVTTILDIIVAGGTNARFCFFKFFPRLITYYSNLAYNVENCFNIEINRLYYLYDLSQDVVELVLFDLEDLLDNLAVCNASPAPGDCISRIGPYYAALFTKTDAKVHFFEQFVAAEASASVNRLGACIHTYKLYNVQNLFTVTTSIQACRTSGPDAPDLGP